MRFTLRVLLAFVLLAPIDAGAQGDDLAYCRKLYDLALRYRARVIMGENKPDPEMIVALDQCQNGNTSAGIATLERKLRSANIDPPPR